MKRSFVVLGIVFVFGLGFIIGQHTPIFRILAREAPTPTITPSPTLKPNPTPTPVPVTQSQIISNSAGPRDDIVQVGSLTASRTTAQVGEDISFSVTVKNQVPSKKLIKQLCFESTDGNFGCTMDFNLYPGQTFTYNNSGRFISGGVKTIWVTWTQDGQNFYRLINGGTIRVTIEQ